MAIITEVSVHINYISGSCGIVVAGGRWVAGAMYIV